MNTENVPLPESESDVTVLRDPTEKTNNRMIISVDPGVLRLSFAALLLVHVEDSVAVGTLVVGVLEAVHEERDQTAAEDQPAAHTQIQAHLHLHLHLHTNIFISSFRRLSAP